jgi:hypothetical protein
LTQLRFYTTAFMAWIAAVLVLTAATVLPPSSSYGTGRRRFAFGALVATLALIAFLDLANPDAWIARANLDRAASGVGQPLDVRYLTSGLSADATPVSVAGLAVISDPKLRTDLACGLQVQEDQLGAMAQRLTWRGGNLGIASARRALTAARAEWEGASRVCP